MSPLVGRGGGLDELRRALDELVHGTSRRLLGSRPPLRLERHGVPLGAAVATAHGLYEVALLSRVPAGGRLAVPVITDGLALVAYAATTRLCDPAARYAWSVVVLA